MLEPECGSLPFFLFTYNWSLRTPGCLWSPLREGKSPRGTASLRSTLHESSGTRWLQGTLENQWSSARRRSTPTRALQNLMQVRPKVPQAHRPNAGGSNEKTSDALMRKLLFRTCLRCVVCPFSSELMLIERPTLGSGESNRNATSW